MATGGGVGGWEFYRVLVTGIPTKTNIDVRINTCMSNLYYVMYDILLAWCVCILYSCC